MREIKVSVPNGDKYIAAMVKALAFQSAPDRNAGQGCVKGSTLDEHGHIVFHFRQEPHFLEFKRALSEYLPNSASIVD
jgi:hypothetical protein